MALDHLTLTTYRDRHPAWRLLASPHAPLVASFLYRVFVAPNVRLTSEADLAEMLEDELFALREQLGVEVYPKTATEYLNDWCAPDKGWLRKFYKPGTDEAQFDLTPATEKAIAWLVSLTERPFVGTESRLLTMFALLEQISTGSEADPARRWRSCVESATRSMPKSAASCPAMCRSWMTRPSKIASCNSSSWRANC